MSDKVIQFCRFQLPAFKTDINIFAGVTHSDYEFFGNFTLGTCGIRIKKAMPEHSGLAKVFLSHPKIYELSHANATVKVRHLQLKSDPINFPVAEYQKVQFECLAHQFNATNMEIFQGKLLSPLFRK